MKGTLRNVLYADAALSSAEIKEKNLRLSIELSLGGFSFSVKNTTDDVFLLSGYTYIKYGSTYTRLLSILIETMETDPVLSSLSYHSAEIIYSDAIYTILPAALYDPSHRTDYLSFSVGRDLTQDKTITSEDIPSHEAVCVYQTQEKIKEYISTKACEVTTHHSASLFLENMRTPASECGIHLHVNMYPTHFMVAATDSLRLLMINTYPMKDVTSFAYYMLSLCNKLQVNERTIPITLYGDPDEYVMQQDVIKRYFHAAEYARRCDKCGFSPALDYVAAYECFNTLNH